MLKISIVVAAAALSAGILAVSPASATPLSGGPLPMLAAGAAGNVDLARSNGERHKRWVYDRNRNGQRFAYRHGQYRFHHDGYWYSRPWWGPGPGIGVAIDPGYGDPGYGDADPGYADADPGYGDEEGGPGYESDGGGQAYSGGQGDAHVQWCMNRYQSYDPRTDTFMGYDQIPHRCNSPY